MKFRALAGLGLLLASGTAAWAQQYVISTIAGGPPAPTPIAAVDASIGHTYAVATDAAGNVYFISDNCVFKLEQQNGVLTPVAGNGSYGVSGDGGPATSAQLLCSQGVALDGAGNLFVADTIAYTISFSTRYTSRIRKVSASGIITTVAGNGTYGFSGDGSPAIFAQLLGAQGVALDGAGNLFIADAERIRKVSPDGIITTVAGNGSQGSSGDGGPAINAYLDRPQGIAVDRAGNLFIADATNNRIRKVPSDGTITTDAGNRS